MSRKYWFTCMHWLILASLLLSAAAPGVAQASAPVDTQASAPADSQAAPVWAAIDSTPPPPRDPKIPYVKGVTGDSAEACGVPETTTFGQDLELMAIKDSTVIQYSQASNWLTHSQLSSVVVSKTNPAATYTLSPPSAAAGTQIAAAAMGSDKAVAVWREPSTSAAANMLVAQFWGIEGWSQSIREHYQAGMAIPSDKGTPVGQPAVVSPLPAEFIAFTRTSAPAILYKRYTTVSGYSDWQQVPGYFTVVGDPVPVVLASNHIGLFFLAKSSPTAAQVNLYYQEMLGSAWRSEPVRLSRPVSSITNLAAVATGDKHLAVFATGAVTNTTTTSLFVRHWDFDTSDGLWNTPGTTTPTAWTSLAGGVAASPLAVVSRNANHMAVAYTTTAAATHIQLSEWSGVNKTWAAAADLGAPGASAPAAISMASSVSNEMVVLAKIGMAVAANFRQPAATPSWTQTWVSTQAKGASGSTPVAVMPSAHRLVVFDVEGDKRVPVFSSYGLVASMSSTASTYSPTNQVKLPNGQLMVRLDGQPYLVNLSWKLGKWSVDLANPNSAWAVASKELPNTGLPSTPSESAYSLAAADMDLDGRDEVVVATIGQSGTQMKYDISWLRLQPGDTNATLAITPTLVSAISALPGSLAVRDLSVAIGDLDNPGWSQVWDDGTQQWTYQPIKSAWPDGKRSEVFVSAATPAGLRMVYFQFNKLSDLPPDSRPNGVTSAYALIEQPFNGMTGYKDIFPRGKNPQFADLATGRFALGSAAGNYLAMFLDQGNGVVAYRLDSNQSTGIRTFPDTPRISVGPAQLMAAGAKMVTGDVNGDTVDEFVIVAQSPGGSRVFVFSPLAPPARISDTKQQYTLSSTNQIMSLALGDIDQDGRQEILTSAGGTGRVLKVSSRVPGGQDIIYQSASFPTIGAAALLAADMDGDSLLASFDHCETKANYTVHTVLHAPPVYYQTDGEPYQWYSGAFGTESGTGDETMTGHAFNYGVSAGIGVNVEILALFVKIAEATSMVTAELMGSVGRSHVEEHATVVGTGDGFDQDLFSRTQGSVLYSKVATECLTYNLADPNIPANQTTLNVCSPVGEASSTSITIEDWYSADVKTAAGDTWFPLGGEYHQDGDGMPKNDLSFYPQRSKAPIDPFRVLYDGSDPLNPDLPNGAKKSVLEITAGSGGGMKSWWTGSSSANSTVREGEIDVNLTVSNEVTIAGIVSANSLTAGYGFQWSNTQSWSKDARFEGTIQQVPSSSCVGCKGYKIAPYIYLNTAKTQGGEQYAYIEQDYFYMGDITMLADEAGQEAQAAAPNPPQAPQVSSPSHPDAGTWYANNDVNFTWSQPAGDSAPLAGYIWSITRAADGKPNPGDPNPTNQHSYQDLADGLFSFNLQAVGADGSLSPITRRAVRIDTTPPQAAIQLDPADPSGMNGWYIQPLTASLSAADEGAGSSGLEYSLDGATWHPYAAALVFGADTPGATLYARASDPLGNLSEPVTATFKIDLARPLVRDVDNQRLSYASIQIQPNGNAQLVLGGVLNDALSGRSTVMLQGGLSGQWTAASEVGEFAMPADNLIPTTQPTLNWFYRPSFEVRGVYPLFNYGLDQAGNKTSTLGIGAFWWEPDSRPDFSESMVSASPAAAQPGEKLTFTIAARNTGFQEALVVMTDTLPTGVTVDPASITGGGQYDPASGQVVWRLGALWPGQTRYEHFRASLAPNLAPATLQNRLDLMGYWEWEAPGYSLPPEPERAYFSSTTPLAVLPAGAAPGAPRLYNTWLVDGALVSDPQVSLQLDASLDAQYFYVKEWTWDNAAAAWAPAQESGWVAFENAPGLAVESNRQRRRAVYDWTLADQEGAHYLGVWVADREGRVSSLNEDNLLHTNLVLPAPHLLPAGEKVQYRLPLQQGELAVFNLLTTAGEANLYAWNPRHGFHPEYYATTTDLGSGIKIQSLAFYAPEDGMYLVEVHAASDASYQLVAATPGRSAGLTAQTQAALHLAADTLEDAARLLLENAGQTLQARTTAPAVPAGLPANPLTFSTPLQLGSVLSLPHVPQTPLYLYFPAVMTAP